MLVFEQHMASLPENPSHKNIDDHSLQSGALTKTNDRLDELLRTADFLFGNTLDGALTLLDQQQSCCQGDRGSTRGDVMVRLVSRQSQRSLYLVKGSTKTRASGSPYYLCMLPTEARKEDGVVYCSCRSFWEKTCRTKADHPLCDCKHLLALRLLPVLGECTLTTWTVETEAEFSQTVMERVFSSFSGLQGSS
jgi:hypothetical protein